MISTYIVNVFHRWFVLIASLAVCASAFGDPNEPIYPTPPDVTVPTTVAVVGLLGIIAVTLFRNLRERIEGEPSSDEQISRRRRGMILSWVSVALWIVAILLFAQFGFLLAMGLYVIGFIVGLIGFIIAVRLRGKAVVSIVPPLLYVAVIFAVLVLSRG